MRGGVAHPRARARRAQRCGFRATHHCQQRRTLRAGLDRTTVWGNTRIALLRRLAPPPGAKSPPALPICFGHVNPNKVAQIVALGVLPCAEAVHWYKTPDDFLAQAAKPGCQFFTNHDTFMLYIYQEN